MGIIYKHTINNKSYIGYTKYSMEDRLLQHIHLINKGVKSKFYNCVRKHGIENIISEVLEICKRDLMGKREIYWIEKLDTYNNGLNLTRGGDGGPIRLGMKNSEYQRNKSSKTQLGKPKKNKGNCGKYERTDQNKKNISDAVKGKIWVSNINTGKAHQILPEFAKKYIDDGYVLGRKNRDFSNDKRNVIISDEQKKKLSEAIKGHEYIFLIKN